MIARIKPYRWAPEFSSLRWFNFSGPIWLVTSRRRRGKVFIRPWNLHRRHAKDFTQWGAGLLQIGSRHLIYLGHMHRDNETAYWMYSVLFLHDTHKQER